MIGPDGTVTHDVRFPHPIERVWRALVDRDALAAWLMPNDFEPRVGHTFHFDAGPPRGRIEAEVLEIDPPRRLVLRWTLDGAATTVTFSLGADGDATRVHLEHTDLPPAIRPKFDTGWVDKFRDLTTALEATP